jgi:retinol dehydrogenase-12
MRARTLVGGASVAAFFGGSVVYREKFGSRLRPGSYEQLPMEGRTVIVTGASSGIGKETARQLARLGCSVVIACRSESRALRAASDIRDSSAAARGVGAAGLGVHSQLMQRGSVQPMVLDLADLASVRHFAEEFAASHQELHALVNNGGTICSAFKRSCDGTELTLATNHVGPALLTALLLPMLERSGTSEGCSRIVNV